MTERQFGAQLTSDGVRFRLWAPGADRVEVLVDQRKLPLQPDGDGWYAGTAAGVKAGAHYRFLIGDKTDVPDPASDFQPEDVSGPSEVIDHAAYPWKASDWRGRPWQDVVLSELHIGTFTTDGTYRAAIDKLDHYAATGITAIELMPLADFPGRYNWGYDGVLWYAPDSVYGRPDDLKALIDEAHLRGLMVFLDVVYNHFGPDGNYLGQYAPSFFCEKQTPWGSAIDYRVQQVRTFAIENALHWLRDYRFDGLRLDAVHAISEPGEVSLLRDLSEAAGAFAKSSGRHIHLVLENDDNIARLLASDEDPPSGRYRAQWNDDYHHAWHVLLTGERHGYYSDYVKGPASDIARALSSGFVFQGQPSSNRNGEARGEPSGKLKPGAFVNFLQNHDQIGNRALGERIEGLAGAKAIEAALTITLLSPNVPMLFMGEEWGAKTPFPFFCDFKGDLADAIRQGRRKEFAAAYAKYGDDVPDPLSRSTFETATLDWSEADQFPEKDRLKLVKELLAIRRREIVPRFTSITFGDASVNDDGLLVAQWRLGGNASLRLQANLSDKSIAHAASSKGRLIWGGADDRTLSPWAVLWHIEES